MSARTTGKRQRADANGAQRAALHRQIEVLEGENAALRSARRLLADEDRALATEAEVKRLRAERRKLTGELRGMRSSIHDAFTNITRIALMGDRLSPVLLAVLIYAEELGVEL